MSLTCIKKHSTDTGTGFVEVHALKGPYYQNFLWHIRTPITEDDGGNFVFALINKTTETGLPFPLDFVLPIPNDTIVTGIDLVGIKTSHTDTGFVEVHILSSDSHYQQFTLHTGTPITVADASNFVFAMAGNDLVGIKTSHTDFVEVYILSGDSHYQQLTLHKTPITVADASNFVFAMVNWIVVSPFFLLPEGKSSITVHLMGIKTRNTGTGSVEVHILSGDSGYQQFLLQTGTPITEDDGSNFVFPSPNIEPV